MSLKFILAATLATAAALAWESAAAQAASEPVSREQRKAETAAANKAGQLAPAGATQKADVAEAARKPTKTREQRKAETEEARKKGQLAPAGEGGPTK